MFGTTLDPSNQFSRNYDECAFNQNNPYPKRNKYDNCATFKTVNLKENRNKSFYRKV